MVFDLGRIDLKIYSSACTPPAKNAYQVKNQWVLSLLYQNKQKYFLFDLHLFQTPVKFNLYLNAYKLIN